ncbi:MAG: hypothetical protein HKM28_05870 [Flavobacteriaceae bacterium]|nr:hypothetical protein [Flavobacteriaceae bacterium]
MKNIKFILTFCAVALMFLQSCKNDEDDGIITIPPRDRGEEAVVATMEIEEYLATHFYNYEEFQSPSPDFDYRIQFDTIAGENAGKIPLIDQVDFKMVQDRVDEDVMYKLYYLKVIQGEGNEVQFPDILDISFEGRFLTNEVFDNSDLPARLDLTAVINGFQDGLSEFNGANETIVNPDGTVSFEGYGVGAVFIPSGLGYFATPPVPEPGSSVTQIGLYQQLIFTFQVYNVIKGDQDNDGVPTVMEDYNNNQIEEDDNFDEDFTLDFNDEDDDNDGRLTRNEITQNNYTLNDGDPEPVLGPDETEVYRVRDFINNTTIITTVVAPDTDNDGQPDYLDEDN